jgi:hypothetical protein
MERTNAPASVWFYKNYDFCAPVARIGFLFANFSSACMRNGWTGSVIQKNWVNSSFTIVMIDERYRSAITGRFVKPWVAERYPETTILDHMRRKTA